MKRDSEARRWRTIGWDAAEMRSPYVVDECFDGDDDAARIELVRVAYPDSRPSQRTYMRQGWRMHRAGADRP